MSEQAIEKLQSEMTKNSDNSYIQAVGEFLLQHLNVNPAAAEKVMTADKSIEKSLDEMRKAAGKKKRVGNCAVLTDQEGFAVVLKYFGIDAVVQAAAPVSKNTVPIPEKVVQSSNASSKSAIDFDIKLEDLL